MAIQITIIGLGQIGGSIGLALANQAELLRRVGHDREHSIARQAEKLGALDKVESNLHSAVRGADLVLLCIPVDQIQETLKLIATDLKDGAVVMDTSPVKEIVATWANEHLPQGRHFVGLMPVINPVYLTEASTGLDAAHADLFKGGLMGIVALPRTGSEAIKLAADLTRLLGANPLFADPLEIDGLMAATHLLPQLLAAALLNATIDQPGWWEGRKVAGSIYAEATAPVIYVQDPQTLGKAVLHNRDNVLRVMDGAIATLQALRGDIQAQDEQSLNQRLQRAIEGRLRWWAQRQAGDWNSEEGKLPPEMPSASEAFGRLFGFGGRKKK